MIQDAIDLDARVEVMDPSADAPCAHLTQRFVQGNLLDAKAVEAFGTGLDCITIEIEGVSVPGLEALERKGVRVVPKPAHIALIQDKGLQKQFFQKHNIATAPFALQMANGDRSALGYPVVQKLRRGGYDGKGVAVLKDASSQHFQGKDAHCVLEQKIDIGHDQLLSQNINSVITLDGNNQPARFDTRDGMHAKAKSIGLEAQFDLAGWSISERARFSKTSGGVVRNLISTVNTASALATSLGGAGATLKYATGPLAGQAITDPSALNGNGLLAQMLLIKYDIPSLDNFTNDLRASRVWKVGDGNLTLTGGVYKSLQTLNTNWLYTSTVQDVVGGGNAALVNVFNAAGVAQTQDGFNAYSLTAASGLYRRTFNVDYDVTAPYGSVNYHIGKIAVGGSLRYDIGDVRGQLIGSDLGGGRAGITSVDFNGDGSLSVAERRTAFLPLATPAPVNYDYRYLSYSAGINFRIAEPLAAFARYSRGARANADKILFTPMVSTTSGALLDSDNGYDVVKQAEGGLKFRKDGLTLNLTGFLADVEDTNLQSGGVTTGRMYHAYGLEFEGAIRRGPFSLTAGATYTDAEIRSDAVNAAVKGMTPRHQPSFIFTAMPQVETRWFTVGANLTGITESYALDVNQLKMPGFTLVDAFVQFRPTDRLQVMINANNLFDTVGFYEIAQNTVPTNGIGWGRSANGRTISASVKLDF